MSMSPSVYEMIKRYEYIILKADYTPNVSTKNILDDQEMAEASGLVS